MIGRRVAIVVALALAACRGGRAANHAAPRSEQWAKVQPSFIEEIVSTKEPMKAFAFGNEILVVRHEENRFRVALLKNGAFVDEEAWSRGLPATQKSSTTPPYACNRVDAIFGRFPDRLWLVENAGGSHDCSSTFGTFVIWRRKNGSWTKDTAHSPAPQQTVAGIFATWPLGPAALGFGISNLVGDTLSLPEDVMWPAATDPWKAPVHLRREGVELLSVCGSTTGTVAALSFSAGKTVLETIASDGSKASIDVPQPLVPDGPCAIGEKEILLVQRGDAPARRETWSSFDRTTRGWTSISVPWPHRTERVDFSGSRIIALTADPKGNKHVFFANREAPSWSELAGFPDADLDVVSMGVDDELLLLVDHTKLVRVGLVRP